MSDARRVIEQAAQYIADHPHRFHFHENQIPIVGYGTRGCALGWIGYFRFNFFSRLFGLRNLDCVAKKLGFKNEGEFYFKMNRICENHIYRRHWTTDPMACAATMRELAQEVA